MKTKIYKNQEKAANEIYERLEVHNDGAVILHSMPQVGKTGTVIDVCQQLAKKNPDYAVLYFGPSDKQLHAQSKVRFKEYPLAFFTLLGNDVYHDGEIYPGTRGTKYKQIVEFIQMANEVGKKFLVVRDEAHIGIGTQDKGLQKIPFWRREKLLCGHQIQGPAIIDQLDTTTIIFLFDPNSERMISATAFNRVTSLTEVPPNFIVRNFILISFSSIYHYSREAEQRVFLLLPILLLHL
mgnify:CR=1 FL=1